MIEKIDVGVADYLNTYIVQHKMSPLNLDKIGQNNASTKAKCASNPIEFEAITVKSIIYLTRSTSGSLMSPKCYINAASVFMLEIHLAGS